MYIRTFFFFIFIISSVIFFLSSYNPYLILNLCESNGWSICKELTMNYIQLTSVITATFSIIIFAIANYYTEKRILAEKERIEADRLNIEKIHAEIEALQK